MRALALRFALGLVFAVAFSWSPARAADAAEDAQLFKKVMDRLLASDLVKQEYPDKLFWPPHAFIKPDSEGEVNAYASSHKLAGATIDEKTKKVVPVVMVTEGMLRTVIKGDENSLAVIMGHEIAHLSKGHTFGKKKETPLLDLEFGRDQEIEADLSGVRYAVSAGYPFRTGVASAFQAMRKTTKYTSFEGLSVTHPTWEDRLAMLDREQAQLWVAMSSYKNGYLFLELEQYVPAQQCFRAVVKDFPDCHEAWANLGYAQLMQYCDGLTAEDLRTYDIGQIVAGGFYTHLDSLEAKVRGGDEKLWKDAVKSLTKAIALKEDVVLPRANLGLAYLVHYDGKNPKQASKWFGEALDRFDQDAGLKNNLQARAAVLVNAGVADIALGSTAEAEKKFQAALKASSMLRLSPLVGTLENAVLYNEALVLLKSSDAAMQKKAFGNLEGYLLSAAPDSAWWGTAFERYQKLAKDQKLEAKPREDLARRPIPDAPLRLLTSVTVGKESISLSEPLTPAVERLGKDGVATPLFPGGKITRWHFEAQGVDLLGKDNVLAIFLTNAKAPSIVLQAAGVGGGTRTLRVGMDAKAAREMLKDQRSEFFLRQIVDPSVSYRFYPALGLAVRFADNRVAELAVAQLPRR